MAAVLVIVVEDDELADEALLLLSLLLAVFSVEADCGVTGAPAVLPMELIDMSLLPFELLAYTVNDGHPSTVACRQNKYEQNSCLL